jgi:hypothetical protein
VSRPAYIAEELDRARDAARRLARSIDGGWWADAAEERLERDIAVVGAVEALLEWVAAPAECDVCGCAPGEVGRVWEIVRVGSELLCDVCIEEDAAAARVFDPALYTIHLTDETDTQRPGFAVRRSLRMTRNPDLAELDIRAGARRSLRRGADITVETPQGTRLRLLSVHLNAGCRDEPLLQSPPPDCEGIAQQARIIAGWVEARRREGIAFAFPTQTLHVHSAKP